MPTFQDINAHLKTINEKSKRLATMTREEIFDLLAEITFLNDEIADFIYQVDKNINSVSTDLLENHPQMSATALRNLIKTHTSSLETDKSWASRQSTNLKDLRISALAAQRDL